MWRWISGAAGLTAALGFFLLNAESAKAVDESLVNCAPATEVCNGKDDDCDGVVDEAPSAEQDALSLCRLEAGGAATCIRTTCENIGARCGTMPDLCGGSLQCGTCPPWAVCQSGICVNP